MKVQTRMGRGRRIWVCPVCCRRIRIDRYVPAETAIHEAMIAVEKMPADVRLTNAVVLLGEAQRHVADFVDGEAARPVYPSTPTLQPEALRALIARWRNIADAVIDDVNQGNAPVCDADWAKAHRDCADELEALLHAGTAQEPTP